MTYPKYDVINWKHWEELIKMFNYSQYTSNYEYSIDNDNYFIMNDKETPNNFIKFKYYEDNDNFPSISNNKTEIVYEDDDMIKNIKRMHQIYHYYSDPPRTTH
jgi:hypothetical protein